LCHASCGWAYGKCKETGEWPSKENQEKWKEMSASPSTSECTRKTYNFKTTIQKRGVGKCDVNLQPIITIDNIDRRIVNLCWFETFLLPEGKHTIEISADGCKTIREEIYVDHDIERDYLLLC
jgi:hypothetical protein